MNEIIHLIIVFSAGAIAGFINVMAGGGSVLTLGVMMLIGLDAPIANGTNRIGILAGAISGASAYNSEKLSNIKESFLLGIWTLPGAIIGSIFAINISNLLFQRILAGVMIFVVITLFRPIANGQNSKEFSKGRNKLIYPTMFLIGLYGGFIQAGVGFLIMFSLRHILGLSLTKINIHKVCIILLYTIPVIFIFGLTKNINWIYAVCLGLGSALGAWLSVKVSVKKGEGVIKIVLCVAILLMAAKFLLTF
ncbi:MAG: sulfite exporter TauE/SafE family protein [Candidatus Omnitrophica bacterium]|nr:sulfite exporter TauE/SafE family protein [Candidatus Omnitrophota bacterium]